MLEAFFTGILEGIPVGMALMLAYYVACWILKREFPSFKRINKVIR